MRFCYVLNCLWLQLGKLLFPLLERVFQRWENRAPGARRYLCQGLVSLNKGETAVALLNLNMVLSLNQDHFLALVSRGRLYLKEDRCRLGAQDFLRANRISKYRFIHYGLSNEYLRSLNMGVKGLDLFTNSSFKEVLESLSELNDGPEEMESSDVTTFHGECSTMEQESQEIKKHPPAFKKLTFSELDRKRFDKFGPITQDEIENTDWDQLIQDFTS